MNQEEDGVPARTGASQACVQRASVRLAQLCPDKATESAQRSPSTQKGVQGALLWGKWFHEPPAPQRELSHRAPHTLSEDSLWSPKWLGHLPQWGCPVNIQCCTACPQSQTPYPHTSQHHPGASPGPALHLGGNEKASWPVHGPSNNTVATGEPQPGLHASFQGSQVN